MEDSFEDFERIFRDLENANAYAKDSHYPNLYEESFSQKPALPSSQIEEVISTSHSEFEVEKIVKAKVQGNLLDCPKCGNSIKPFQYKEGMAIFMCSSAEVKSFFKHFSNFSK